MFNLLPEEFRSGKWQQRSLKLESNAMIKFIL